MGLTADYFDGRSTRVRSVRLAASGEDLLIVGDDIEARVPLARVTVDERLGRAPRRLRFEDGSFCEVADLRALDTLLASMSHRDGWIDRWQRHGRLVVLSLVVFLMLVVAGNRWVLPWAAAQWAANMPIAVSTRLSIQTLRVLDGKILLPSRIAQARRRALGDQFHALRLPEGGNPTYALLFRKSPQLGANAFTLPDGTIVVLDDLVAVIDDDNQIMATLAHEAGHAHGHHGLQLLLRSSVVGAFLAFYIGDVSSLLAVLPASLMQARFSRDLEEQADDYAAATLARNGMSPALLAQALSKLANSRRDEAPMDYLSSHPATAERMRHLQALSASFEKR